VSSRRAARAASSRLTFSGGVPLELYDRNADQWWRGLGNRDPRRARLVSDITTARNRRSAAIADYCLPRGFVDEHGNPKLPPRATVHPARQKESA
jgi:hypothetical protein